MTTLSIKTAEEFRTLEALERQASRRAGRETPLVQHILRLFVDRGGPVRIDDLVKASDGPRAAAMREALTRLDAEDLIRIRDDHVDIAYPFSTGPTAFVVRVGAGRERYACCATDALGIAPMVGQRIEIRSRCHHSGVPLEFSVTPDGPGPDAAGVMLWIGKVSEAGCKAADGL